MIERASPSDVMELDCDVTGTSMQVAAALVLGPGPAGRVVDLQSLQRAIARRIVAIPRMRQRLVSTPFGCGRPAWIDDADFDIRRHVRTSPCPSPGDEKAMLAVVAELVTHRLPPDQPLWTATLITGMSEGRSALLVMFHHVLADGIGGLAVLAGLVDGHASPTSDAAQRFPRPAARRRDLRRDALRGLARAIRAMPGELRRLPAAFSELGAGRTTSAPRCSLNRPVGTDRALATARADLTAVRAVAHSNGGTVNDVLLTAVTGAVRTVLARRGEAVDRLVISIPVSSRVQASATELGNRVGVIPVELPVTGDPVDRLQQIARITAARKGAAPGASAALIGPAFRALAKIGVFNWFISRQRLVNTFVTNLRGPDHRLAFGGAPIVDVIAIPMVTGNITVAFAAMSYAGRLTVTVIADPEQCADLQDIAAVLQNELDCLTSPVAAVATG